MSELKHKIGDYIQIIGLKNKKEWNGLYGIIIGNKNKNNRYPIKIIIEMNSNIKQALLRENNIIKLSKNTKYIVCKTKNKGYGTFAVKIIKKGDIIIKENAIINVKKRNGTIDKNDLYKQSKELSSDMIDKIMMLYSQYNVGKKYGNDIDGRMKMFINNIMSNAFGTIHDDRVNLYLNISRINHSCLPNCEAIQKYDELFDHYTNTVIATRNINIGDEILYNYLHDNMPYNKRQAKLYQNWGFTCKCIKCIKESQK